MKIHHVIMLSLSLATLFLTLCLLQGKKVAQYGNSSVGYAVKLQSACYNAAKTINISHIRNSSGAWDAPSARNLTLDIFYRSLALNLGTDGTDRNEAAEMTPIVVLVDNGGFYVSYNACFDTYNNTKIPISADGHSVISGLNTYSETYAGVAVHFYLTDYVEIILPDGCYLSGKRQEVYDELPDETKLSLSFMASENKFAEFRSYTVTTRIEETLNYYLNTQFINVDTFNTGYQISIPRTSGECWARAIENPSIIAFFQGEQDYVDGKLLSSYAYAAGEMSVGDLFFIQDGYYYRVDSSLNIQKVLEDGIYKYFYNGEQINQFFTSMKECAAMGATPSDQIFLH